DKIGIICTERSSVRSGFLSQTNFVFSRRQNRINISVDTSVFCTLIIDSSRILVKTIKRSHFPVPFGYLAQQFPVFIILINMVPSISLTCPKEAVVAQKNQIICYIHISIVFFL